MNLSIKHLIVISMCLYALYGRIQVGVRPDIFLLITSQMITGAVVWWLARRTFDRTVGGSEGRWFEARLVSSLLCCFLRQETLLHIVSLHPGV